MTRHQRLRGAIASWRLMAALVAAPVLLGSGAIATISAGASASARVAEIVCSAPAWNSTTAYSGGAQVTYNNHQWRANWWNRNVPPPGGYVWSDLGTCAASTTSTSTTVPASSFPVRDKYRNAGPYATTMHAETALFTVYRPATLSTTYKHPIITWANGTQDTNICATDHALNKRLASWGYVVVCANDGSTGTGDEVWAAAQHMIRQNTTSGSVFFGKLNTAKVGAAGHSQGACGAINATVKAAGVIKSSMMIAYVDPFYAGLVCPPEPNWGALTTPAFLMWGSNDFITTQPEQRRKYDAVTTAPVAMAAKKGSDHNTIITDPANLSIAYTTAWFKYTLEGDAQARSAFVVTNGVQPEQVRDTANWEFVASKRLP